MDKVVFFATMILFHIVTLTSWHIQPVLRPWILACFNYLYRYVLLPYATFWLDHFYILCGIVAAYIFYYLIRVLSYTEMKNPFTEMAGCGDCYWCKNGNPMAICERDPGNRQRALHLQDKCGDGCTTCLLTHYVGEFREKLTKQNVDDLRERLHQKGVLDGSDMDELHQHLTSSMAVQLSVLFSKLSKKKNGYDMLIEVLQDLDEAERHNNWFGDLAKELMTKFCRECRKRYPKGYPILFGIEFFTVKTFTIFSESLPTFKALNTTTSIKWHDHGINVSFPKCSTQAEVTIGVIFNGHFKLPLGTDLVSPVYNITTVGILEKSISVELKHCAILENSTDEALLSFVKAEPPSDDKKEHGSYEYKMHYYTNDETCFSRYGSQSGTTIIPLSNAPIQSFLIAVVKSKGKWLKVFSRDLQCSYRLQVFYSRPRFSASIQEWEATIVATRDLPSYTKMLKTEFPSDHFSSGPSTVACLGEDGLSIELPKQGKVTGNRWRVTPATNRKITRHQIDYRGVNPTLLSPSITLKLKWLGRVPVHYHNGVEGEPPSTQWSLPELDLVLVTNGTRKPFPCDLLPLHFKPDSTENGSSSSSTFGELPFDEYTTSEIDLLSVMKFNVWKMLKNLKLRVRIFVSLSVEISVPGTYVLCMCRTLGSNLRRGKDNL